MAMAPGKGAAAGFGNSTDDDRQVHTPGLNYFVFALFFIFGGITSLNDVILPKLQELFTLSYTEAMLVQFCFFTAYLLIGIPGAELVKRVGYMRGAVAGLLTMMVGCLLFIPASQAAIYGLFLAALFILASGVVVVQVVTNPLISLLGLQKTVHSRLTFAQAFNSLGTTIFPRVGSGLILGGLAGGSAKELSGAELDAYRTAESAAIVSTHRPCGGAGGDCSRRVGVSQQAAARCRGRAGRRTDNARALSRRAGADPCGRLAGDPGQRTAGHRAADDRSRNLAVG